ncbi:inclusion body family protein [Xenorhabdus bovienii]|uniref:AidA/PixA family protein n=1 Tax=Xenorhabdus bovienii TaxID=40576 RepID=UPI0023B2C914|nr:AidA/PixA family protein [Xenorhabdus bovienii]MDE9519842.1 inclusion body family protein [Xenorhabdus bovienii]
MSNIDIIVAIDEKAIYDHNQYTNDFNKPALVDSKYIHVLTYAGNGVAVTDNSGKELKLSSINSGDNIRWKIISLSPVDVHYYTILTSVVPDNHDLYTQYIDRTVNKIQSNKMPVADGYGGIDIKDVTEHYWLNVVKKSVPSAPQVIRLSYVGNFILYREDVVLGYCRWKHNLTLSN